MRTSSAGEGGTVSTVAMLFYGTRAVKTLKGWEQIDDHDDHWNHRHPKKKEEGGYSEVAVEDTL